MSDLYPFQREGVAFLLNHAQEPLRDRCAYLADRMGLGKTIQAAAAAKVLRPLSVVVVAKASAVENWKREWAKWGPGKGTVVQFVSWASAHRVTEPPDLLILDEAHYAKNPSARRTKAVWRLAEHAGRVWALSGTPMPNHPGELFSPMWALWPDICSRLGVTNTWAWENRFCRVTQTKWGRKVWGMRNADELKPYLQRILLRRTVEDVGIQLPPARLDIHYLEPVVSGADEIPHLDALQKELEAEMDSESGSLSRARRILGRIKAPRVADILEDELEEGQYEKVVVLAYHHDVLELLRERLGKFGVTGFDGSTPPAKRQAAIDYFTNGDARVFVGQSTAAGDSINLQVASEIVLVEPAWSPSDNAQAIKRVHRIGSENPVRARVFALTGSLDEAIIETITRKTRMAMEVEL